MEISSFNDLIRKYQHQYKISPIDLFENQYYRTGYWTLDQEINGFGKNTINIIAGRPAMGKTALCTNIAFNIASEGTKVGYISTEISELELLKIFLKHYSIKSGSMTILSNKKSRLFRNLESDLISDNDFNMEIPIPLSLHGSFLMDIQDVIKACTTMIARGVHIIFIDCIHLISLDGKLLNLQEEYGQPPSMDVRDIINPLITLFIDHDITLVFTAQLSPDLELRGGAPEPKMGDLKWKHTLEDIADQVILIHRPEYYGMTQNHLGQALNGDSTLLIPKNRHERNYEVHIKFLPNWGVFADHNDLNAMKLNDNMR